MLGLDTGWNCHISLSSDANKNTVLTQQKQIEQDSLENNFLKLQQTVISLDERALNKNRFKKPKAKRLKKRKLKNYLSKSKSIFSQSLPSLKLNDTGNSDENSLLGLSSQIVKFDLSNIDKTKEKSRASRKLYRLNSVDDSFDESSSSDSSQDNQIEKIVESSNKKRLFVMEINNSKSSVSSFKSNSIAFKKTVPKNSISVSSKLQEDENSSHRTVHSGRTLSDTEILGNAVSLYF
jgi:hypothetical protein